MQPMRELLRASLRTSLEALPALDRLATAWPVTAGHTIAERSTVTELESGVATVRVHGGGAWLDQLRRMTPQLRAELAKVSGIPLTDILFVEADAPPQKRSRLAQDPNT